MCGQYLPEEMNVCFFKMESGYKCLRLNGNKIEFDFNKKIVNPSPNEWENFWEKLEDIGFWEWEQDYEKCCMADGFKWNIKINKDGKLQESAGINDGPSQFRGGSIIYSLDILLDAIEDLCGFRLD